MSEFRVKAGKLDYFLVSEKAWGKKKKKKAPCLKASHTFTNPQVIKLRKSH